MSTGRQTHPSGPHIRAAAVVGVTILHAGMLALLAINTPAFERPVPAPPIEVELVRPQSPLEPPPPAIDLTTGGGAPATPSRVHVPPDPPPDAPESPMPAPPEPAPAPTPQIGAAPIQTDEGRGQGGRGEGIGSGVGPGQGNGAGASPPRLIRTPERVELRALHPPQALRARQGGAASIRCRIRADGALEACVAERESPPGQGFGAAAVRAAPYFRFEPPRINGRQVGGQEVTLRVEFMVR